MRKKIICLGLAICAFFSLAPVTASSSGYLFLACGDAQLYPLSSAPYYSGGLYYAPYTAFTFFGINYNYFPEKTTAMVYSNAKNKVLYFDLAAGTCTSEDDVQQGASALLRGGVVYLPVIFTCAQFGLRSSYISSEYGDILRIKSGSEVLSDSSFISAARTQMQIYAADGGAGGSPSESPAPTSSPAPGMEDFNVYLSFSGLPTTDILNQLDQAGYHACFFVTAEEVSASPDIVRRIAGSGHAIGALLSPGDPAGSFETIQKCILEAAHVNTILAASDGDDAACAEFARLHSLAYKKSDITGGDALTDITSALAVRKDSAVIRLICDKHTPQILSGLITYLKNEKYTVKPLLEV